MFKDITMVACKDSTSLNCFGYNSKNKELHVVFKDKNHYVFFDVPIKHFKLLACSDSRGAYFSKNIREKFSCDIINE